MKAYQTLILLTLITVFQSCKAQEDLSINYIAQTRGFFYSAQLHNSKLEINKNNTLKKIDLNKEQTTDLFEFMSKIDFNKIEENLDEENLAVDSAIKSNLIIKINNKNYSFNFGHNNLHNQIESLLNKLESYK